MSEEWRSVVGWEGRYEVSDYGRIRSKDMICGARSQGQALRRGRTLVQVPKQGRYLAVTFADGTRRVQRMVHDVVAAAFLGPKPRGCLTLHGDDDKGNNAVANLRYGTHKENEEDKLRNGNRCLGERHPQATVTEITVRAIRAATGSAKEIAARFDTTTAIVHQIRSGRTWRHVK